MPKPCALTDLNLNPAQLEAFLALQSSVQLLHENSKRDALKIQALSYELARYRRIRFAARSEQFSPDQRALFDEDLLADGSAIETELTQLEPAPKTRQPRQKAGRQPLPEHLPRQIVRHEPESCACAQCGQTMVAIGEDVTEQLDIEPVHFKVIRHVRPKYVCRPCEQIVSAPVAPAIVDGGLAAPGLIAWILVSKFLDHLPLYRLEQMAAREGVSLARSTLAQWVGSYSVALQPLAERLAQLLKERPVLHADETPVQQLDPGKGKTRRSYLWVYRSNDLDPGPPIVLFDYQSSRSGVHARTFLAGWQGTLMVDDYAGYKALFAQGITELGCMAHARRGFFDLHAAHQNPVAAQALARIGALYALEAQAKDSTIEQRQMLRQAQALPQLAELHAFLQHALMRAAPGSALAKALSYSLKRWPALTRYAHSGHLPIDNNPVENSIRPIAIGKKNWLFVGSERAGKRASVIQSLLATAKLNGLNPTQWLKTTLERLPTHPNNRLDELLPLRPN